MSEGGEWEYQPHRDLHKVLKPHLAAHYERYCKGKIDKTTIPTYFFLSGAGTGKSRNGTEFHRTLVECSRQGSDLRARLEKAKVFLVSLENGMSLSSSELISPLEAIGIRMLSQLLGEEILFEDIRGAYVAPTPLQVFSSVAQCEGEDIYKELTGVLVVDGLQCLMKSAGDGLDKHSEFYRALTEIGDTAMNRAGIFIILCCTATVTVPVEEFIASTHRRRVFLPVASLRPPMIKRDAALAPVFEDHPLVSRLVGDCGGHGRALESLQVALRERNVADCDLDHLMTEICVTLQGRYSEALKLGAQILKPVLRAILARCLLRPSDKIPGTDRTVDSVVQPGLIQLDTTSEGGGFGISGYLTAPYIWIWMLAKAPGFDLDPILRDWDFCDYNQLRSLLGDTDTPPGGRFWQDFEHFVARFRVLRSKIFPDGSKTSISEIHAGARLSGDVKVINRHLKLRQAARRHPTATTSSRGPALVECTTATINLRKCQDCVMNAAGAPSGDYFLGLKAREKPQALNEVGQCKSYGDSKLSKEMFDKKRSKAASENDFFLLYTTDSESNFELPERSGIVNGANWERYFGPFSGRAFRLRSVKAKQKLLSPGDSNESGSVG
jgi:hypothetical protein